MTINETIMRIRPGDSSWISIGKDAAKWCRDRSPTGCNCTRGSGHGGVHAAHYEDGSLLLITWPQEPEHPVIEGRLWCESDEGLARKDLHRPCPGPHYTVLRGDLIGPPHVHDWLVFYNLGSKVTWYCPNCPDALVDSRHAYRTTQAPKPKEGS